MSINSLSISITLRITTILIPFLSISLWISDAFCYGYKRNEDPLIKVFKGVIYYGKQDNWRQITEEINSINDRIKDIHDLFGIDLAPRLKQAIDKHDFQYLVTNMANLVFQALREKFYWNQTERLEIYIKATVRMRLAEEYYVTLLSGNVREYDIKNGANFNEEIYQMFTNAHAALGSLGFFGVGAIKPELEKFVEITNRIEEKLLTVFPYFER